MTYTTIPPERLDEIESGISDASAFGYHALYFPVEDMRALVAAARENERLREVLKQARSWVQASYDATSWSPGASRQSKYALEHIDAALAGDPPSSSPRSLSRG